MFYFAFKLHRWKSLLYPLMWLVNPFLSWIFMTYGIFTAGQRTWGGPRADAGAADAKVTPQQAIEHAIATGDELNVVPETFRPAVEFRKRRTRPSHLQPTSSVEGRFFSAEQEAITPGILESALNESIRSKGNGTSRRRRFEHGSLDMSDSDSVSLHTPKFVNNVREQEGGADVQGGDETQRRPRSTVHFSEPLSRDSCPRSTGGGLSGQGDGAAESSGDRRPLTYPGGRRKVRQGDSQHVDNRSPLGRNSPLTAISTEDETLVEADEGRGSFVSSEGNAASGGKRRSKTLQLKRLQKRSPSPGGMV